MPKELTHWILADRALACLSTGSRLRGIILEHHDSYLGGAILPDTLLHPFRSPYSATAQGLARSFHDSAGNSFAPLIRAEQRCPDGLPPATLACLLGVITHMQADIVYHPYVYAVSGTDGIGQHYRLETDIDVQLLRMGARPAIRHVTDLITPATRSIMVDCCALLFDPEGRLPRHALEQALKQHCRIQGLYDRTFWKLAVRLAGRLAGAPFSEQRHLFYPLTGERGAILDADAVQWRHPVNGELRLTGLEQLADEAVQRIAAQFERIEDAGSLADALHDSPGENLLTGMHGACLSECNPAGRNNGSGPESEENQMDPHSGALAQKEFDQAELELERGNVLAALACLERALAIWNDPLWHSRLGYCIAKERGQISRAFELCRSAIAHDPKNPIHYLYLGKVHLIAADQFEALQALRQGMTLGSTPEIERTLAAIGTRKPPVIPALSRNNPLNKYLGIILSRLGLR